MAPAMDSDLLQKLHRRRQLMGESGSPLTGHEGGEVAAPATAKSSVALNCDVHVKQRAQNFQRAMEEANGADGERGDKSFTNSQFCLGYWSAKERAQAEAAASVPQSARGPTLASSKAKGRATEEELRLLPTPSRSRRSGPPTDGAGARGGAPSSDEVGEQDEREESEAAAASRVDESQQQQQHQRQLFADLEDEEAPIFETQVLRPLRDWLADNARVPTPPPQPAEDAAFFSLDAGAEALRGGAFPPSANTDAHPGAAAAAIADAGPSAGGAADVHGPLEYDILDYFDQLPEGLMGKLKGNLDMHENLVQQLYKRSKLLQGKAPTLAPAQTTVAGAEEAAAPQPSAVAQAGESWRRELRAQMAGRVLAAQEARQRLGAEAHEAAMRAKLECMRRSAQERHTVMTKRAEREEEECRCQAASAKLERERVRRDLEAARREVARIKAQQAEGEGEIRTMETRCRELERARKPRAKEAEALRNELKAHRARNSKNQSMEQRLKDLERELETTQKELANTQEQVEAFGGSAALPAFTPR